MMAAAAMKNISDSELAIESSEPEVS